MSAYYNEWEPYAAEWLRNLIKRGLIAPGDVDERSIVDVTADDVRGYTQCHFFAGIGGWSYALRLARWPDDRPVWTGSCPCQPFSTAGKQRGSEDERHLWPAFFRLIRECRPAAVFGEQVAGAAGLAWLDHVCADLEGEGYAAAAADLPAAGVGAPHRRQRLFWVADAGEGGRALERAARLHDHRQPGHDSAGCGEVCRMDDAECPRLEGYPGHGDDGDGPGRDRAQPVGSTSKASPLDPWADIEWLACSDGKARPTQPGIFPLAHGVSGKVGRLRAYGNAIVPQVAAEFVMAFDECRP